MRKAIIGAALAAIVGAVLVLPGTVGAKGVPAVAKYGPIASGSTDSSTCGNDWATDTYERNFSVRTKPDANGNYTFDEEFKNGSFVTMAGNSPGACDTNPGGTVGAGITGKMHGYYTGVVVSGGTFNPDAVCTAVTCGTTTAFVATVFGPSATWGANDYDWAFFYNAGSHGEWKNAGASRGGNHGDITGN